MFKPLLRRPAISTGTTTITRMVFAQLVLQGDRVDEKSKSEKIQIIRRPSRNG